MLNIDVRDRETPPHHTESSPLLIEQVGVLRHLRHRASVGIGALALAVTPPFILSVDIYATKEGYSINQPVIHPIAEALDENTSNSASIFIDGFGSKNPSWTARKMVDVIQLIDDGAVYALEYEDATIDPESIAEEIAELVLDPDNPISSVTLYGYSIGGGVATETAEFLIRKFGIDVDKIVLDHAPVDGSAIRQAQRKLGETVLSVIDTANSFGIEIEHSSIIRNLIIASQNGAYNHIQSSTALLKSQYVTGVSSDITGDLKAISEATDDLPEIMYISSTKPSTDYMVDVRQSSYEILPYARDLGFETVFIQVDGAIHSRLDLTVEAYMAAVSDKLED